MVFSCPRKEVNPTSRPQYDFQIATFRPVAKVVLYSRGNRYELYDDLIQVTTSKSKSSPSGTFSVQVVDRIGTDGLTWQQRAQVMDYCEIYMGNQPQEPQIIMRGFVINAQRIFDIGATGGPSRYTQLNGVDLGYIFQANQVRYLWQFDPTAIIASSLQLDATYHIGPGPYSPKAFIENVFSTIINGDGIARMRQQIPQIPDFEVVSDLPDGYEMNLISVQPFTGAYWNLLSYFKSAPFSEMFYLDLPSGPIFLYRQPPYRLLDGSPTGVFTAPFATLPTADVPLAQKKTHALGKSANEMYAFLMVYSDQVTITPGGSFNYAPFFGGAALGLDKPGAVTSSIGTKSPSNPIYDESIEARYGFQPLNINTPFISAFIPAPKGTSSTQANSLQQQWLSGVNSTAVSMCTWLYHVYKDNAQFESGTLTVHGRPDLLPGAYVRIPEWDSEYYMQTVNHTLVQYQTWTSDLSVLRGYTYGRQTAPVLFSY